MKLQEAVFLVTFNDGRMGLFDAEDMLSPKSIVNDDNLHLMRTAMSSGAQVEIVTAEEGRARYLANKEKQS